MPSTLRRFAPAKINLGLSVLGLLPGGYHALHTLMVPLDVGDELEVSPADTLSLRVQGADLPTDAGNLVYRAARAYLDAAGEGAGADIVLHKRLPLASGLGGGSSDAASTLLALAELYPAAVDLHALATALGADVPFFLHSGPALAEGIGERLTPMTLPPLHLVLINPGTAVSAADAYRWLDETQQFTPPLDVPGIGTALATGQPLPYFNALQAGVAARHPEIGAALAALSAAGLHSPLMSGSGSTCFALAHTRAQAQETAAELQNSHPDSWIRAAGML
ncbi:4-(cytidine 5'-diphospho)-2-C-methyl-D-erythritol kinase [Deinococcus ruber]|uniref:4-diphosphocytidyl-2-C-methyl-D-erythritol kinase n=1 Tax=Deinococcus ruber TaxID=1848197 RepID=A0A918C4H8_9DEIO|nr:4-(cytidine 5'-diphospho)-2-C-methyl-D-erythritol kinase [Deinococcus ruber]GGR04750.1 4-diphosphocytidyl-2-C-methyl-D-erythritol kinase [Deinococcus ruber]